MKEVRHMQQSEQENTDVYPLCIMSSHETAAYCTTFASYHAIFCCVHYVQGVCMIHSTASRRYDRSDVAS